MANHDHIKAHMEVLGSDGKHGGIVDNLEGAGRIKLTKNDPKAGGKHHFIPLDWVDRVNTHVHLNRTSRDAIAQWQAA
jgi:hypothetical protein